MAITIRPAVIEDQQAIVALVRSERLNPNGLFWANFVVARDGNVLVGAAQIRRFADGAAELGSLVVAPAWRGNRLSARLIQALLTTEHGAVYLVTGRQNAHHYAHWGFAPVTLTEAPASTRRNCVLGQVIGGAHALVTGRRINRLVVLRREAPSLEADAALARCA